VIRALRLLALFTALFVVSLRCSSGFPLTAVCSSLSEFGASQFCPASEEPHEQDTLAAVFSDDSDDGADALIAPTAPRIQLLTHGAATRGDRGALAAERALPSHAPSLERPPRA